MSAATITELEQAPTVEGLEAAPFSVGDDPTAEARLALPISAATGSPNTLVYLEVDPGKQIPLHTHTSEEVFVVLEGEGIVTSGDRQWAASAGSIAVAPPFEKHGWENTGTETLRIVGFFGANVLVTEFEAPVAPFGVAAFATPVGA
jgi:quercetin dioxygenase-like cupin family protein